MKKIKSFIQSFTGIKGAIDFIINLAVSISTMVLAKFKIVLISNEDLFFTITAVVVLDAIFGVLVNIKKFETNRALKMVWYLCGYYSITFVVLFIEKSHPAAFWLSETVIMPILVFQIISILKHASKLKLIPIPVVNDILSKIDKHKDEN